MCLQANAPAHSRQMFLLGFACFHACIHDCSVLTSQYASSRKATPMIDIHTIRHGGKRFQFILTAVLSVSSVKLWLRLK